MYNNKALCLSDCDATNFELEQAVLESSLESFRNFEHGRKQASSSSSNAATANYARRPRPPAAGLARVDERDVGPMSVSTTGMYIVCFISPSVFKEQYSHSK